MQVLIHFGRIFCKEFKLCILGTCIVLNPIFYPVMFQKPSSLVHFQRLLALLGRNGWKMIKVRLRFFNLYVKVQKGVLEWRENICIQTKYQWSSSLMPSSLWFWFIHFYMYVWLPRLHAKGLHYTGVTKTCIKINIAWNPQSVWSKSIL